MEYGTGKISSIKAAPDPWETMMLARAQSLLTKGGKAAPLPTVEQAAPLVRKQQEAMLARRADANDWLAVFLFALASALIIAALRFSLWLSSVLPKGTGSCLAGIAAAVFFIAGITSIIRTWRGENV